MLRMGSYRLLKGGSIAGIGLYCLLVLVISLLLRQTYTTQAQLHEMLLMRYQGEAERAATILGGFFAERCAELDDLAQAREIALFFENKALGMSMQYGLKASLLKMRQRLAQLLTEEQVLGRSVYTRILFLDSEGQPLVDCAAPGGRTRPTASWAALLAPHHRETTMVFGEAATASLPVFSKAFYFKDRFAGQLIAWVDCDGAFQHLHQSASFTGSPDFTLIGPNGFIGTCAAREDWHGMGFEALRRVPADRFTPTNKMEGEVGVKGMLLRIPIEETPLSLITLSLGSELPETSAFWGLPLALGVLSLTGLLGIGFGWFISLRYVVLRKDMEESAARQKVIDQKNLKLRQEIAQRRRIEAYLQKSEERFQLAIAGGDLGTWDWNIRTGHVTFNDRWAGMLGYEPEDLAPDFKTWKNLLHPEDAGRVLKTLRHHLSGKSSTYESEHRHITKSGGEKWILAKGRVIEHDEAGRPLRAVGTHLDIDEKKRAEALLRTSELEYRAKLEKMVRKRTKKLYQTQRELINKAFEAGQAQFSAMILHNIGNALTPIGAYLEYFKKPHWQLIIDHMEKCHTSLEPCFDAANGDVPAGDRETEIFAYLGKLIARSKQHLERNQDNIGQIDDVFGHIAAIIRLQSSYALNGNTSRESCDLNRLFLDALEMQAAALEKRGISVDRQLADPLPKVILDKSKMVQVLINVIKNGYEAIDAMKARGLVQGRLTVRSFCDDNHIGIAVTDNGAGIEPDRLSEIFDYGTSAKGSTGFGLPYCKMFVALNKGNFDIASDGPGTGATVTITFGIDAEGLPPTRQSAAARNADIQKPADLT